MGANARALFLLQHDFSTCAHGNPMSEPTVSMPMLDAEPTECTVEVLTTQSYIQLHGVIILTK